MGSPKVLEGYPQPGLGNKRVSTFIHTGPASYVQVAVAVPPTGGDPVTDTEAGGRYIEAFLGDSVSDNGQFRVEAIPSAGNPSQAQPNGGTVGCPQRTWLLRWIVAATGAEVAGAVNLAGRTVRLTVVMSK